MGKLKRLSIVILVILFIGGAFATLKILPMIRFATQPSDIRSTEMLYILVPSGMAPFSLAKELENQGLITSATRFHQLGRYMNYWEKLKAGDYGLRQSMTPIQIFRVLTSGRSTGRPITIPEGQNIFQIAERLESFGMGKREKFLSLMRDPKIIGAANLANPNPKTLEGFLFPETYIFHRMMSPREVISTMTTRFSQVWKLEYDQRASEVGLSKLQAVTLASIIEKETGVPEERKLISSVFHNRLKKNMRLQTDPTIIYGIWEQYDGNIRREDKTSKNEYNTYLIKGLPIGPIANPGEASIIAALYPEDSNYLFFVSKNNGTHKFTTTYEDHQKAVQKFQLNRAAREGKSWRDRLNSPAKKND